MLEVVDVPSVKSINGTMLVVANLSSEASNGLTVWSNAKLSLMAKRECLEKTRERF